MTRDGRGFVTTGHDLMRGHDLPASWPLERPPFLLETSVPGVFAAGDVRRGSVKRVASAAGEGGTAIRLVHEHLGAIADPPTGGDGRGDPVASIGGARTP